MTKAVFIFCIQMGLPYFFGENDVQKLDSVQDFAVLLKRMRKIPAQLDQVGSWRVKEVDCLQMS